MPTTSGPVRPILDGEGISPKAGMFTKTMGDEECVMGAFEPGADRSLSMPVWQQLSAERKLPTEQRKCHRSRRRRDFAGIVTEETP